MTNQLIIFCITFTTLDLHVLCRCPPINSLKLWFAIEKGFRMHVKVMKFDYVTMTQSSKYFILMFIENIEDREMIIEEPIW